MTLSPNLSPHYDKKLVTNFVTNFCDKSCDQFAKFDEKFSEKFCESPNWVINWSLGLVTNSVVNQSWWRIWHQICHQIPSCFYMIEDNKKNCVNFQMVTFSLSTPAFGKPERRTAKKRTFCIFRNIGWLVRPEKIPTSTYSGSRSIVPKIVDFGPPGVPQWTFQNILPIFE